MPSTHPTVVGKPNSKTQINKNKVSKRFHTQVNNDNSNSTYHNLLIVRKNKIQTIKYPKTQL